MEWVWPACTYGLRHSFRIDRLVSGTLQASFEHFFRAEHEGTVSILCYVHNVLTSGIFHLALTVSKGDRREYGFHGIPKLYGIMYVIPYSIPDSLAIIHRGTVPLTTRGLSPRR